MRTRRVAAAAIVFALSLASARDARAFCRSRTVKIPADYNAQQQGCIQGGVPLFWRNACAGYSINQQASKKISYEDVANLMSEAFTRWTGATCPVDEQGRSRPSIDVRDLGPVSCDKVETNSAYPNQNVILFRDDSWPYPPQVLGLTSVRYNTTTGEIYGADMEINTYDMQPFAIKDPVAEGEYDFLSVVTHEAGHFLGMAHSDVENSTMFFSYDRGLTVSRELRADDIDGICSIYRPDGSRTVLNTRVFVAPGCDPTPIGGYSTQCIDKGCNSSGRSSFDPSFLVAVAAVALRRRRSSSR